MTLCDLIFENERVVDFEDFGGDLLFDSVQFTLGDCTNM